MTPLLWCVVAVAGAGGALLRHEITSRAADRLTALHAINILGAGLLGLVVAAAPTSSTVAAVGAGGLGALTSFSTWMVAARDRSLSRHIVLPMALAIGAALLGTLAGRAMGGTL